MPSGDHAVFTVNGQTTTITPTNTVGIGAFGSSTYIDGTYQEHQGTFVSNIFGTPIESVSWSLMKEIDVTTSPTNSPTEAEIDAMFVVQSYPYGKFQGEVGVANGMNGARVTYHDGVQTEWTTDKGTGDQTGSTFQIISMTANPNTGLLTQQTILVNFSCKLYDDNGNVKTLTNGSMRGPAVIYF